MRMHSRARRSSARARSLVFLPKNRATVNMRPIFFGHRSYARFGREYAIEAHFLQLWLKKRVKLF